MSFNRKEQRALRHKRLRQRIKGTAVRPRMAICISNQHMYVQFVDDDAMHTLAATSTLKADKACNLETAKLVGEQAASVAKEKGYRWWSLTVAAKNSMAALSRLWILLSLQV